MESSRSTHSNTSFKPTKLNDIELYSYYHTISKSMIILLCNHVLEIVNILCFILSNILMLLCIFLLTVSLYISKLIKDNCAEYNLPCLKDIIDTIMNINTKQISTYINVIYTMSNSLIDHSIVSDGEDEDNHKENSNENTDISVETNEYDTDDTSDQSSNNTSQETPDNPDESGDKEVSDEVNNTDSSENE
jgi:hypothetical protein